MKNIVFIGSMRFAVPILQGLRNHYQISLVVTQPDKPFGRKQILKQTPVKEMALELELPLFQPVSLKAEYHPVLATNPDLIVVCAYGQMLPDELLQTPPFQCINVHASLLPKYRGGSPMHRAIQNGDVMTGVTVMIMHTKMDSGPILSQKSIPIDDMDDVGSLELKLSELGRDLLLETLPLYFNHELMRVAQEPTEVSFAYHIKPEEEKLDLSKSARALYNHIRAFHPWPLTYLFVDGQKIRIFESEVIDEDSQENEPGSILLMDKKNLYIQTGKGILGLKKVQIEGKKPLAIEAFLNGQAKKLLFLGKILK